MLPLRPVSGRGIGAGIGQLSDSPKTPEYETIGPTRVLPHIYLGCVKDALCADTRKVLALERAHHITNISVGQYPPPSHELGV